MRVLALIPVLMLAACGDSPAEHELRLSCGAELLGRTTVTIDELDSADYGFMKMPGNTLTIAFYAGHPGKKDYIHYGGCSSTNGEITHVMSGTRTWMIK